MIIRTPPKITNRNSVVKYVEIDLWSWLKELSIGVLKLDFLQNFQSFRVNDLVIPVNTEVAIPNGFRTAYPGVIPSSRVIVRQKGDANVVDGDTVWNQNQVFLKNPSLTNEVTISVIFFK